MKDWYVGRLANFKQDWRESYRRLLRTIDSCADWSVARIIRYTKPISKKNDRYIYLGVSANTKTEAEQIAIAIFDAAQERYQVGFNAPLPPQLMDDKLSSFLTPTEFPSDGRIPEEPAREEEDPAGAFTYYDLPALQDANDLVDPAPFDRLLQWLSAAGEGRWESFLRVARILGVADDAPTARRLFRRFVLLGHLESSPDGRAWTIAPPVLVQSAAKPETAFWCGGRSVSLLRSLSTSWQAGATVPQPDGFGPSKQSYIVPLDGDDHGLHPCTEPPGWLSPAWGGLVAERLTALLPGIEEWTNTLSPMSSLTPPEAVEQWDFRSGQFQPQTKFRIEVSGRCSGPKRGFYRITYGEAPRLFHLTVFFDDAAAASGRQLLRGEWYSLRFLALHRSGKYLKAMWRDEDGGSLAISHRQRWPLLYERALVLASGLLPQRHPENGLLYYRGIPLTLAQSIAEHLGVQVETCCESASV